MPLHPAKCNVVSVTLQQTCQDLALKLIDTRQISKLCMYDVRIISIHISSLGISCPFTVNSTQLSLCPWCARLYLIFFCLNFSDSCQWKCSRFLFPFVSISILLDKQLFLHVHKVSWQTVYQYILFWQDGYRLCSNTSLGFPSLKNALVFLTLWQPECTSVLRPSTCGFIFLSVYFSLAWCWNCIDSSDSPMSDSAGCTWEPSSHRVVWQGTYLYSGSFFLGGSG